METRNKLKLDADKFFIVVTKGKFEEEFSKQMDRLKAIKDQVAVFAFLDPCGFSGIPFSVVRKVLTFPKGEVLVNFMSGFINRFIKEENRRQVFESLFGTDSVVANIKESPNDWKELTADGRQKHLVQAYEEQLKVCRVIFIIGRGTYWAADRGGRFHL